MKINLTIVGILYITGFMSIASAKPVVVSWVQKDTIGAILLLLILFIPTWLFFLLQKVGKNWQPFKILVSSNAKTLFWVNVYTLAAWSGYFVAVAYIPPTVESFIAYGVGPILTVVANKYMRPNSPALLIEKISAVVISVSMLILAYLTIKGDTTIAGVSSHKRIFGLILAFVSGVGVSGYLLYSRKLSDNGWDVKSIMAGRFPLLVISCTVYLLLNPNQFSVNGSATTVLPILTLLIFMTIVPVYWYQKGVEKIEPIYVSILITITPILTSFWQLLYKDHIKFPLEYSLLLVPGIIFMVLGILKRTKSQK